MTKGDNTHIIFTKENIMKNIIADGNTAASLAAYFFSEDVAIYPITPSSPMAENIDQWQAQNKKNLFNEKVKVHEMQSEAGAAATVHGLASAGALTSTFTSSQGLLLMIPSMYKIAGEKLPCVFHVAARSIASHALSIFGDHSDVMAVRQTGFALISSSSPQEAHDFAIISHLASLRSSVPFLHFFDGFRTSHELRKINILEENDLKKLTDFSLIQKFKNHALNSENPTCKGTSQNTDTFFQNREASQPIYTSLPEIVEDEMSKFAKLTGRTHRLFEYFGKKNAEIVFVCMGSGVETIKQVANEKGFGVVAVKLYRPFSSKHFVATLPKSCKKIVVLDRVKEDGAVFEPLCEDVISALANESKTVKVIGGRYGIGGKEFTPSDVFAAFENAKKKSHKNHFTVGIDDDVSFSSLPKKEYQIKTQDYSCKFFGLGSDGTVSASKNSLKIIGEHLGKCVQGFFEYDSKKSGSITTSHLRISEKEFDEPYLPESYDFIACHHPSFISKFNVVDRIKNGGTFLLNCPFNEKELNDLLPNEIKKQIISKKVKFFTINANKIALALALGDKINLIMQSAFFFLSKIIDFEKAKELMKQFAEKTYASKGSDVLEANLGAIDSAPVNLKQIKLDRFLNDKKQISKNSNNAYFEKIIKPISLLEGNKIPVSAFKANGEVPTGTTKLEKRGFCGKIPDWNSEKCIQCGLCSLVCPHSCIRPVLIKKGSKKPKGFVCVDAKMHPGYECRVQVSAPFCTGCGHCAYVCPTKAITITDSEKTYLKEEKNFEFASKIELPENLKLNNLIPSALQFKKPLFEYPGACSGCGETPYIKILTQLFGDHLIIANATGCSSIYGGNSPTCPYAKNKNGRGPAWQNSLFEDNAEFGFGLYLAYKSRREKIKSNLTALCEKLEESDKKTVKNYLANFASYEKTLSLAPEIEKICKNSKSENAKNILMEKGALVKQTFWLVGGDGWAYDIGFSGLDHVIAQNEDINILVLDTNVYSNTGGQASKATPFGASAKFAQEGKKTNRKNLARMMMTYPGTYVAQIALGANMMQTINALSEAQAHVGPSLVIAYSTCINQGFNLSKGLEHQKNAVACGLWNLFRYNPDLDKKFTLDFKEITLPLKEFWMSENRFRNVYQKDEKEGEKLLKHAEDEIKKSLEELKKLDVDL